jgi:aspartate carbamoyltransferase regulatory subunit
MPATLEVKCTNDECEMDMFEMHYTYDMPDDVGVGVFQCPYCERTDTLEAIEL